MSAFHVVLATERISVHELIIDRVAPSGDARLKLAGKSQASG